MQRPDNVTDWYDHQIHPARVGWYDTSGVDPYNPPADLPDFAERFYFRKWWDGVHWKYGPRGQPCMIQRCYWRGQNSAV